MNQQGVSMNQREQELLDKQLWGVSPRPPLNAGIIGLTSLSFVVVFLAGIAIGDILFAHERKHMRVASHNATAAISLLESVHSSLPTANP
jgi:hypothetical protein